MHCFFLLYSKIPFYILYFSLYKISLFYIPRFLSVLFQLCFGGCIPSCVLYMTLATINSSHSLSTFCSYQCITGRATSRDRWVFFWIMVSRSQDNIALYWLDSSLCFCMKSTDWYSPFQSFSPWHHWDDRNRRMPYCTHLIGTNQGKGGKKIFKMFAVMARQQLCDSCCPFL